MTIDIKALGKALKARREELGATQQTCCAEAGINQNSWSRIEAGYTMPTSETYAKLCTWLGQSLDEFVTESVPEAA